MILREKKFKKIYLNGSVFSEVAIAVYKKKSVKQKEVLRSFKNFGRGRGKELKELKGLGG